jgi:hypothetical protein
MKTKILLAALLLSAATNSQAVFAPFIRPAHVKSPDEIGHWITIEADKKRGTVPQIRR